MIDALLFSWDNNDDYAQRLVADLPDAQMTHQPAANMNHPAWVLSHLHAYHPVIVALIQGQTFDDPKHHPFGMQSKPVVDASVYPTKAVLVDAFVQGHAQVKSALAASDSAALNAPVLLDRWKTVMPTVALALGYLMLLHEATHLGQLSAWRRVQGLPSV